MHDRAFTTGRIIWDVFSEWLVIVGLHQDQL